MLIFIPSSCTAASDTWKKKTVSVCGFISVLTSSYDKTKLSLVKLLFEPNVLCPVSSILFPVLFYSLGSLLFDVDFASCSCFPTTVIALIDLTCVSYPCILNPAPVLLPRSLFDCLLCLSSFLFFYLGFCLSALSAYWFLTTASSGIKELAPWTLFLCTAHWPTSRLSMM